MVIKSNFLNQVKSYLIFFSINLLITSDIFYSISIKDGNYILLLFLIHFIFIVSSQYALVTIYRKFFLKNYQLLQCFFIASNLFLFKLSSYEIYYNIFLNIGSEIFLFCLILILLSFLYKKFQYKKILLVLVLISLSHPIAQFSHNIKSYNHNENTPPLKLPKFSQFPNVYLIGIDALGPFSIINEQLMTDIGFNKEITDNKIEINNGLGFGYTRYTWNSILTLGLTEDVYYEGPNVRPYPHSQHNLLIDIFKNNNYKIISNLPAVFYKNEYEYNEINPLNSKICLSSAKILGLDKYYYLCNKEILKFYHSFLSTLNVKKIFSNENKLSNFGDMIQSIKNNNERKLYVYHLIVTGHAPQDFNINNHKKFSAYRNDYLESFKKVNSLITELYLKILEKDKNSIVLFFGDHNLWLYSNNYKNFKKNAKKYFFDRFPNQIFFLKTENQCATKNLDFIRNYNFQYNVILGLIKCLSKEESFNNKFFLERSIYGREELKIDKYIYSDFQKYFQN